MYKEVMRQMHSRDPLRVHSHLDCSVANSSVIKGSINITFSSDKCK